MAVAAVLFAATGLPADAQAGNGKILIEIVGLPKHLKAPFVVAEHGVALRYTAKRVARDRFLVAQAKPSTYRFVSAAVRSTRSAPNARRGDVFAPGNPLATVRSGATARLRLRFHRFRTPGPTAGASHVSMGDEMFACAVINSAAACWGELGKKGLPKVYIKRGATAISSGTNHACAIQAGGAVRCWGRQHAQRPPAAALGTEDSGARFGDPLGSGAVAIAAGQDASCALTAGNQVWCWGSNAFGLLGDGQSHGQSATPVRVIESAATQIAVGTNLACALLEDTSVWCWGEMGRTMAPFKVIEEGATKLGEGHKDCAVLIGGELACWNEVRAPKGGPSRFRNQPVLRSLPGLVASAHAHDHDCGLFGSRVRCWGSNTFGQLGNGRRRSTEKPMTAVPDGASEVSVGSDASCAIVHGAVMCWGSDRSSILGSGYVPRTGYAPPSRYPVYIGRPR